MLTFNLTDSGVQAITWSAVEANVGIICACMVALKPLAAKCFPSVLEDETIPEHCMRLPMMQTSFGLEDGAALCSPGTEVPTSPSTAKSKGSIGTLQRPSVAATLPGMPQTEGLSFVDMLMAGAELEAGQGRG
jgi:hypothetical protein